MPGAPVSLELESSRASLTCKLASSDWLWQRRAATPPSPMSVCVCVCVCVSSAAGLEEGGAALIALDSTGSSIHVSHTDTHTHTHTYTKTHTHTTHTQTHTCNIYVYIQYIRTAHIETLLVTASQLHSYSLGTPMDTQSHTYNFTHSGHTLKCLKQACQAPPHF